MSQPTQRVGAVYRVCTVSPRGHASERPLTRPGNALRLGFFALVNVEILFIELQGTIILVKYKERKGKQENRKILGNRTTKNQS